MIRLEEIRERWQAATPGPWELFAMDSGHSKFDMQVSVITPDTGDTICDMDGLGRSSNEELAKDDGMADGIAIAHAPADIAALTRAIEATLKLCDETDVGSYEAQQEWLVGSIRAAITTALDSQP